MGEADRRWLEDALKSAMIDLSKRMQDIKQTLDAPGGGGGGDAAAAAEGAGGSAGGGASLEDKERLLDELMDIVEQIDLARGAPELGAGGPAEVASGRCGPGAPCWFCTRRPPGCLTTPIPPVPAPCHCRRPADHRRPADAAGPAGQPAREPALARGRGGGHMRAEQPAHAGAGAVGRGGRVAGVERWPIAVRCWATAGGICCC